MVMTDKQIDAFIKWHKEMYGDTSKATGTGELATVYSDNPEETEKEHEELWKNKLTEIMGPRVAKRKYIHRGGRQDTWLGKAFEVLWLYCSPIFKSNKEKEDAVK